MIIKRIPVRITVIEPKAVFILGKKLIITQFAPVTVIIISIYKRIFGVEQIFYERLGVRIIFPLSYLEIIIGIKFRVIRTKKSP